ncbi:flavin reductase family protein [Cypionkella sp.]|jgi:flavin reductase|uniref:flavin reductase family protein n=1 Tax=Cypionkella sp. TaxID=2811411 RepID=UPI00271920A2|nr:flavin reductase family protein [Cypionkella sp.]MDO8984030.1 flavin reductase family protein [Cypionkella sp.]MDP1578132.1 flavin reductase family protein [Cypionkella sp.]MDP2049231.1 flavin reductase family protein [Cypionkella sp.]
MTDLRHHFIEGMSRASTFVAVITTDGAAGRFGVTVSSMTSLSADGAGPSLLVCIHHLSPAATAILHNRTFCANLLSAAQHGTSDLFSGRQKPQGDRFDAVKWHAGQAGQPILTEASASFECSLKTALLWETHYIMVGEVSAVALTDNHDALLYGQRGYKRAVHIP